MARAYQQCPPPVLRTSRTSVVSYPPCAPQIPHTRSTFCSRLDALTSCIHNCVQIRNRMVAWRCFILWHLILCQTTIRSAWIHHHLPFLRSMAVFTPPLHFTDKRLDLIRQIRCAYRNTPSTQDLSSLFCFVQPHALFTIAVRSPHAYYEGKTIP